MHLIFVHGWAFHFGIWRDVIASLDLDADISCVDLVFFSNSTQASDVFSNLNIKILKADQANECPTEDVIAIGHSLGVLWLLKHIPQNLHGFISISGFDRFVPHVNERVLMAMDRGLERNPARQLSQFWTSCGLENYDRPSPEDITHLKTGLCWLRTWDAQYERQKLDVPQLVLAAKNDHIVSGAMSCDIWGERRLTWHDTGGHALPLTAPEWVAKHITDFLYELKKEKS